MCVCVRVFVCIFFVFLYLLGQEWYIEEGCLPLLALLTSRSSTYHLRLAEETKINGHFLFRVRILSIFCVIVPSFIIGIDWASICFQIAIQFGL